MARSAPDWPRMMRRDFAAAYCDLSAAGFLREVLNGTPPPIHHPGASVMSGELKACAHCGGRGEMDQFSPDAMDEWRVICADKACEAWGPEASTRDAAITAWNRRAPGWEGIETAPPAMFVLATRFDHDAGVWVMAVVFSPPSYPFTHWQPLPAAPADGGK